MQLWWECSHLWLKKACLVINLVFFRHHKISQCCRQCFASIFAWSDRRCWVLMIPPLSSPDARLKSEARSSSEQLHGCLQDVLHLAKQAPRFANALVDVCGTITSYSVRHWCSSGVRKQSNFNFHGNYLLGQFAWKSLRLSLIPLRNEILLKCCKMEFGRLSITFQNTYPISVPLRLS